MHDGVSSIALDLSDLLTSTNVNNSAAAGSPFLEYTNTLGFDGFKTRGPMIKMSPNTEFLWKFSKFYSFTYIV